MLSLCFMLAFAARAQDQPPDSLPVRRIYVPNNRVGELSDRYPELQSLSREECEDLLHRAGRRADSRTYYLESSKFQASLNGNRLQGTAQLRGRGRPDATSLLQWPVSEWFIESARWDSDDAVIGYSGRGQFGLVIPAGEAYTLNLNWSAPGHVSAAGRRFDFQIPPCLRSEWTLDLPPGLRPVASGGSVVAAASNADAQRWLIQWSPADRVSLLITDEASAQPLPSLIAYEREMTADISAEATELLARFRVTVAHQPTKVLEFTGSPGVEIYGWSGLKVQDSQFRDGRLQLALSEPLLGTEQITLHALAPGPFGGRWQLPNLELAGAVWIDGSVRVGAASNLNLIDLQSPHLLDFVPAGAGDRPEWILPHARPQESLTARVVPSENLVMARVRTAIELGAELQAEATVTWDVAAGEASALAVRIPPGWTIQAVEGVPAAAVTRWSVASDADSAAIVTFHLSRPAFGHSPIVAQIRLRGPDLDPSMASSRVTIPRVRAVGAQTNDELVTVRSEPPWSAELVELKQVTVIAQSAASADGSPSLQLRFDGPQAAGTLVVAHKPAEYTANLESQIEVTESLTQVKYQLDIEWPGTQSDTVDVRWTAPTGADLRWELPAGFQPVQLGDDPENVPAETWRVRLARKAGRRVRLIARWQTKTDHAFQIPLPTMPQAAANTGTAILKSAPELTVQAQSTGLMTTSSLSSGRRDSAHTEERVETWHYGKDITGLSLSVKPNERLVAQDPWVAHMRLRTSLDGRGSSFHQLGCDIRNAAGRHFELQLPAGSVVERVSSQEAAVTQITADRLSVSGPLALDSWELNVDYRLAVDPLGRCGRQNISLPQVPFAVSHFTWEVDPPSEYAAVSWSPELTAVPPHPANSWAQRLFGPLLRPDGRGVFRFWDASAWRAWWATQWHTADEGYELRLQESLSEFTRSVRLRDRSWGRLCAHLDQFTNHRLVIDAVGLQRAGIALSDAAHLTETGQPQDLFGLASLAGVNIVRSAHALILTTHREASALARMRKSGLRSLRSDGGLPAAIDHATLHGSDPSGRFVLFGRRDELSETGAVIARREPPLDPMAELWRFEAVNQPSALSLTLVQCRLVHDVETIIVVIGIALAVSRKMRPARSTFFALSIIAAIGFVLAVTVPDSLAPMGAATGWTSLIVIAAWSRIPAALVRRPDQVQPHSLSTSARVSAGLLLLLTLCAPERAAGQIERSDRDEPKPLILFIPFDAAQPEKRNEATRVLLPRSTHERLLEMANSTAGPSNLVFFRSTKISGRMRQDRLELGIDVELDKLGGEQSTRVLIPLRGLVVRSAQLDERTCPLEPGDGGLYVDCRGVGRHQLHLDTVLALDAAESGGILDLLVPPAPRCDFHLSMPHTLRFEVDSAVSAEISQDQNVRQLSAQLACAGRLSGRWSRDLGTAARWRTDTAELFTWRGQSASLEIRTTVNVEAGSLQMLTIEPDARLSLRRVKAPGLANYWLRSDGEKIQWVLEFERPIDKAVPIVLDCLMREMPHVGGTVPDVNVVGAQPGTKLIAFRGDEKSRIRVVEPRNAVLMGAGEFGAVWREPPPRSLDAVVSLAADSSPVVVDRVDLVQPTGLQIQSDLRATRSRVETQTRIVGDASAHGIWHELALPKGMTLSGVRVSPGTYWTLLRDEAGSTVRPAVARQGTDSNLSAHPDSDDRILWTGALTGDTTPSIEINGWIPRPDGPESLPLIRPIGDCPLGGTVVVWRTRDLTVAMQGVEGMRVKASKPDLRPPSAELVLDTYLEIEGADFAATWNTELRSARVSATVATRVLVDDAVSEWISVVDCQVTDGGMQSIEMSLPASLPADVQLSGEGILRRQAIQQGDRQLWKVYLAEPQWHSYRFMLRARLAPDADGRVVVPLVIPQHVSDVRQFLLVLNATENELNIRGTEHKEPVSGETFGKWFSDPITKAVAGACELSGSPDVIEVQPVAEKREVTEQVLTLERHRVCISLGDPIWIESTLLVRSRSSGELVLRLPPNSSAYDIRANGRPIRSSMDTNGRLLIYLSENDRLHDVVVRWRWDTIGARANDPNRRITLTRLTEFDCPTVWTVFVPTGSRLQSSSTANTCPSAVPLAEAKALAKQLEYLIELPRASDDEARVPILGELENALMTVADVTRQTLDAEAEVGLGTRKLHDAHDQGSQQLAELMALNRSMLQRLSLTGIRLRAETQPSRSFTGPRAGARPGDGAAPDHSESVAARRTVLGKPYFYVTGGEDLSIAIQTLSARPTIATVGPALLIGVGSWCVGMLLSAVRFKASRPSLLLAAAGLLWCWKLRPEPIGPALLLGAAIWSFVALRRNRLSKKFAPVRP